MPHLSLIVATLGRTQELNVLLRSLEQQIFKDFELIVIDQNPDDRLVPLLKTWAANMTESAAGQPPIRVTHLRAKPGLSSARNLGIAHSSGDLLAFPDDDCWYLPDTLHNVSSWFKRNEEYGILCLGSRDDDGRISGNRWYAEQCDLTWRNVFQASVSYSIFLRRPENRSLLHFDESLGVGTRYGSGEDTDLILTLMEHQIRGRFFSLIYVVHPRKGHFSSQRAQQYGSGWGRVLAKHSLLALCAGLIGYDFVRAGLSLMRGNGNKASIMWAHGRSMMATYLATMRLRHT